MKSANTHIIIRQRLSKAIHGAKRRQRANKYQDKRRFYVDANGAGLTLMQADALWHAGRKSL